MTVQSHSPGSPSWGATTKLIVGLTFVGLVTALLFYFRNIIGPLLLAFILAYLLQPVAVRMMGTLKIPWRTSVNLIYILLIILLVGSITLAGLAVVQQIQSLIGFVGDFVNNLPKLIADLSTQSYKVGPFEFSLGQLNLNLQDLTNQLLGAVQPLLGRLTGLISTFAASTAVTLGWGVFVLLISYFLLAEAGHFPDELVHVEIPGYSNDIRRLGYELRNIWNAFLRGQLIIISLVIIFNTILLSIVGMRYAAGIAILAGLARFVPYLGPLIVWITIALVAIFQDGNYLGLAPLQYAILVIALGVILDQIFDNLVTPRFLAQKLGVHPAAVLVAAIIAASLIGIIGLVLSAPVLATLSMIGRYILRKMFDLDPWPVLDQKIEPVVLPIARWSRRLRTWWRKIRRR